jgi:hypothetical protein
MKCPRLVPALFCVALLGSQVRGAEPFDVEKGAVSAAAPTGASIVGIDARCTFLRTNGENACPSWPINLANLGLKAGDLIRLDVLGNFSYSAGELPDEVKQMIGVFSSSATLLPADWQKRVDGAIDAGTDTPTAPTLVGGRDTDIAQDFFISSLKIRIPAGARYLFIAAPDIFYSDNTDPDANYAVRIAVF